MGRVQTNFIANLKRFRRRQGLTEEKLAELCNLTCAYIGEIEIGRKFPSHTALDKFSEALRVKPYQLLADENDIEAFDKQELLTQICERLEVVIPTKIRDEVMGFERGNSVDCC